MADSRRNAFGSRASIPRLAGQSDARAWVTNRRVGKRYIICRSVANACEHQRTLLFRGKVGFF